MYPQRELIRLAHHKAVLQRRIVLHRVQCAADATRVLRPVTWWSGLLAGWRLLAPIAAVPLSLFAGQTIFRHSPLLRAAVRWAPPILRVVREFRALGSARTQRA